MKVGGFSGSRPFCLMFVGVALFEIRIPHAHSLKEKRMVMRSLRDTIRKRHEISFAEVALHDLHQRGRFAIAIVSGDGPTIERMFESIEREIEEQGDALLVGSTREVLPFDADASLDLPGLV